MANFDSTRLDLLYFDCFVFICVQEIVFATCSWSMLSFASAVLLLLFILNLFVSVLLLLSLCNAVAISCCLC